MAANKAEGGKHTALKALVIGLGVVILALFGAVVYGLLRQADRLERIPAMSETAVAVPRGCELAAVVPDDALLILRLTGPVERGCQQAVIVDPVAGTVVGRVRLQPED